jgi:poly(hydroxyalkanoate) depolymerase family esterase
MAATWRTVWRKLGAPLTAGWVPGRFAPSRGAARQPHDYFLYIPAAVTRRERVPLLVMLHGCSQDARAFAEGTRMNELADEHRFIVLYPEQSRRANPMRCWNWFDLDRRGGAGEAATIAALVRNVTRRYPVDRSRIYVAGISAGGAMTAMLAFCYGAIFAACAIVAGLMYRAADSTLGAVQAMHGGARLSPESGAREAARGKSRDLGFVPALIMHGSRDRVVHPRNAEQIVGQFRRFAELVVPPKPLSDPVERHITGEGRSYQQRDYELNEQVLLRSILIDGLGHAWSGGDERHSFNDAVQPDASRLIWDFVSGFQRPPHGHWPVTRFWARFWRG